jgi:hypothetical protein
LSTEKPIRAHDALWEALRLREEVESLAREVNSRGPTAALQLRAKDLRKRLKAQGRTIEQGLAFEEGVSIAFRQRNGRSPVDGDTITPEDDIRAGQIATALLSKPPGGLTN